MKDLEFHEGLLTKVVERLRPDAIKNVTSRDGEVLLIEFWDGTRWTAVAPPR